MSDFLRGLLSTFNFGPTRSELEGDDLLTEHEALAADVWAVSYDIGVAFTRHPIHFPTEETYKREG